MIAAANQNKLNGNKQQPTITVTPRSNNVNNSNTVTPRRKNSKSNGSQSVNGTAVSTPISTTSTTAQTPGSKTVNVNTSIQSQSGPVNESEILSQLDKANA